MSKRRPLVPPRSQSTPVHSVRVLAWPSVAVAALAGFALAPGTTGAVRQSFLWAAGLLALWIVILAIRGRANGRQLRITAAFGLAPSLQALAVSLILVYWGLFWIALLGALVLIAAQVVFAYAVDMALSWSRRDSYDFGPWPLVVAVSVNLFLRFQGELFAWQLVMVAGAVIAPAVLHRNRNGGEVPVFNGCAFVLALAALGLLATGRTGATWGPELATLLILPSQMYAVIFAAALPWLIAAGTTAITMSAVVTVYLFSAAYFAVTGSYFFVDASLPIGAFLAMHLLITDSETAPESDLGRVLFGIAFGASVVALYAALDRAGAPTFFGHLMPAPLLSLLASRFDRVAGAIGFTGPARMAAGATPWLRRTAYAGVWVLVFGAMSAAQSVGDQHPGRSIRFWIEACDSGRVNGCRNLARLETQYCNGGSGWSCNELAILGASQKAATPPPADLFDFACFSGFPQACENLKQVKSGSTAFQHGDPQLGDFRFLLQEGRGPLPDAPPQSLFARACDAGWVSGCTDLGFALVPVDKSQAATLWEGACTKQHAQACVNLAVMYRQGDGVAKDETKAAAYLQQACDLKLERACGMLGELKVPAP